VIPLPRPVLFDGELGYLLTRKASGTDFRCETTRVQWEAVDRSAIDGDSPAIAPSDHANPNGCRETFIRV